MDSLFDSSVRLIQWLQTNYPELEGLMTFVSTLGLFEFYLAVIPLIYWTIHKAFGKHVAYMMSLGLFINSALKELLRGPRPYWLDSSFALADDPDFGIPSGHAQLSSMFYFLIAIWARKGWVWGLAIFMAILMGLSRLFLGVHFWHDVLAGYIVSVLLLVDYWIYRRYVRSRLRNRILGQRLLVVVTVPLVMALIYFAVRLLVGTADTTVAWVQFLDAAELKAFEDMATGGAMMLGLGIGFLLEASRTNFSVAGPLWQRAARYLVGIIILVGLWFGSGLVFPEDPLLLAIPLRVLRYTFLGLFMSYWAPALFVRFGLAPAGPGPETSLSVSSDSLLKG